MVKACRYVIVDVPCGFEPRLVQDFQRNILFPRSQRWDIVSILCLRAVLDSCENKYIRGQRWQYVRYV